MMFPTADG